MDILDLIKNKDGYFFNAYYRKFKDSEPKYFTYKELTNPTEKYSAIINNLMTIENSMIIQTVWDCGYEVNGYITTQDGKMWQIKDIQEDCKNSRAVSFMINSPKREFTIGLVIYDNTKGLK